MFGVELWYRAGGPHQHWIGSWTSVHVLFKSGDTVATCTCHAILHADVSKVHRRKRSSWEIVPNKVRLVLLCTAQREGFCCTKYWAEALGVAHNCIVQLYCSTATIGGAYARIKCEHANKQVAVRIGCMCGG